MRDKVEKLLRNYPAYRYAIRQIEKHRPFPQAGVANYSGMPSGSGVPERFFDQIGKMADMGNLTLKDAIDYRDYKLAVEAVEGAFETLTDDEKSVIKKKWMDNLTLQQISEISFIPLRTVKSRHKTALSKLGICFRFVNPPQIENIPTEEEGTKGSQHLRFVQTSNRLNSMDIT